MYRESIIRNEQKKKTNNLPKKLKHSDLAIFVFNLFKTSDGTKERLGIYKIHIGKGYVIPYCTLYIQ